ncbi:MAG: M1 family aminopeptidase [Anaeromyxobacter sp.]
MLLVLAATLGLAAGAPAAAPVSGPAAALRVDEAPPLLDLPADVRAVRAQVELEVDPAADGFRGTIALEVTLAQPRRVIWLHGRGLSVDEAVVEAGGVKAPAAYAQVTPEGVASLTLAAPVGPGPATLRLRWRAPWGALAGLYVSRQGDDRYAVTHLEAVDARGMLPCFDEPAAKIPWEVTVLAPDGLAALSNQPAASSAPAPGGKRRWVFAPTRPLPSYLLFVGVGPFDVVPDGPLPPNEVRPRPLPVRGLAPRGRGKELEVALEQAAKIVPALERYFGVPFPYDKLDHVAISDFAPGGMENAGAIAYRDAAFLFADGRTPEAMRRRIGSLTSHELGHQWFGDMVTLRSWTDVWLNEAFATWVTPKGLAPWPSWRAELQTLRGAGDAMDRDGFASARKIRQPLSRISEVGLQFDVMSYQKGAAVLAMFERFAGPERFRAGVKAYLEKHRDGVATTADFLEALSAAAGRDLGPAFSSFLDQPGVPLVRAERVCEKGKASVLLRQSRWQPRGAVPAPAQLWKIPVCVRAGAGKESAEACTLLEAAEGVLDLPGPCPDWIHPNAGGAGYYRFSLEGPDLARLLGRGLASLTAAEKISVGQSIEAAEAAGQLRYAELAGAAVALAQDPDLDVALSVRGVFEDARVRLVPPADRAAVEATVVRLYRPAFDRLGWYPRGGEDVEDRRHRAELFDLLVSTGRDRELRAQAVAKAAEWLGLGGKAPDTSAVPVDLVGTALAAAVQDDPRAFDAALARAPDAKGSQRYQLLAALRRTTDPARFARAWALKDDPRLGKRERLSAVAEWPEEAQPLVTEAFLADVDAIVKLLPTENVSGLPRYAGRPCDAARAARVKAALEPRVAAEPGMRRPLDQLLEGAGICAAAREANGEAAAKTFRVLGRAPVKASGGKP